MNRLILCILLVLPASLFAQGTLQLRYQMEGTAQTATSERIQTQRQSILKSVYKSVPANALDQVTVSLYAADNKLVESTQAWVLNDGKVMSAEGSEAIAFEATTGNYTVVVTQQSHLPLISKPVSLNGQVLDMTSPATLKEGCYITLDGKAAAFAGNVSDSSFEKNSFINAMDYFWVRYYQHNSEAGSNGYPKGDLNLDGKVDDSDIAIVERNANQIRSATFQPIH